MACLCPPAPGTPTHRRLSLRALLTGCVLPSLREDLDSQGTGTGTAPAQPGLVAPSRVINRSSSRKAAFCLQEAAPE